MITLRNDQLTVKVNPHGAELQSIVRQRDQRELLWQGDPNYWGRRSPILFPIVGKLWNGKYRIGGKEYQLPRHGFARDMDFSITEQRTDEATFTVGDTEQTRAAYPFRFSLSIAYRLEEDSLRVIWTVRNADEKEMLFQIGGHPAFQLAKPAEGIIRIDADKHITRLPTTPDGFIGESETDADNLLGLWHFTEDDFSDDAIILGNSKVRAIALADADDDHIVTVEFPHPCVGIWTPYGKHAPFICIEPWYGIADKQDFKGDFADKQLMNRLQPGATWSSGYTIKA